MIIQQVQSNSFEAKPKYIPQDLSENMGTLIRKMRAETKTSTTGDIWQSTHVRGVTVKDGGSIKDGKFLARRNEADELVPFGENFTMIEMGKSRLIINNQTRELVEHKKPFFTSWNSIYRKASLLILDALNHYSNPDFVQKIFIKKEGLTQSGAEKADKALKPLFDFIDGMIEKCKK